MKSIKSIQKASRLIDTGERPILILCSDLNEYICKHTDSTVARSLFNEYLAASYLKLWNVACPDFAFVKVDLEHIPEEFCLPNHYFDKLCFGSKYSKLYNEIGNQTQQLDKRRIRNIAANRLNLLKITLFDLWMANEDRTQDNYNLLIDPSNNYDYVPIDHTQIFNSNANGEIEILEEFNSLAKSELLKNIVQQKDLTKFFVEELKDVFYQCVKQCKEGTEQILSKTPECWNIDLAKVDQRLKNELFVPAWEQKVLASFFDYLNSPFK